MDGQVGSFREVLTQQAVGVVGISARAFGSCCFADASYLSCQANRLLALRRSLALRKESDLLYFLAAVHISLNPSVHELLSLQVCAIHMATV